MSILKSTGLGADKARMDILYSRREEFYNEINVWNSDKKVKDDNLIWKPEISKVTAMMLVWMMYKVKYIHEKSTRLSSSIF